MSQGYIQEFTCIMQNCLYHIHVCYFVMCPIMSSAILIQENRYTRGKLQVTNRQKHPSTLIEWDIKLTCRYGAKSPAECSLPGFSLGPLYISWCQMNTSTSVFYHPGTPCQKQLFVRYTLSSPSLLVFLTLSSGCTKCVDFLKVRLNQLFIVQSHNSSFAIDLLPELVSWRLVEGLLQ